jgi:hypothetical protein
MVRIMPGMTVQRWALAGTAVMVVVLTMTFAVLGWDRADKAGSMVSALAAVASVGVAVWAAWPAASGNGSVRVSDTGKATTGGGGRANAGFTGPAGSMPGRVRVRRTGDADARDGDANSGVELT